MCFILWVSGCSNTKREHTDEVDISAEQDLKKCREIIDTYNQMNQTRCICFTMIDDVEQEDYKVIDVDKDDSFDKSVDELTDLYIKTIESCKPYKKIVAVIPTKSGKHIVTHPFDSSDFYLKIGELVKLGSNLIKKNDMTLLYENI